MGLSCKISLKPIHWLYPCHAHGRNWWSPPGYVHHQMHSNAIWLISVSPCFSQKLPWFVPFINLILIGGCVSVVSYWYFWKWMYSIKPFSVFSILVLLNIIKHKKQHIKHYQTILDILDIKPSNLGIPIIQETSINSSCQQPVFSAPSVPPAQSESQGVICEVPRWP